jgi:two-component system, NarL family, sensor histidine kinase UhpB
VRLILESLRPRILDEEGVEASVHWLARQFRERTDRESHMGITLFDEPDAHVGLAIFRIVQEALTNVARHAEASRVEVSLVEKGPHVTLTITDDGRGLAAEVAAHRHGLIGMKERAIAVGTLEITSPASMGARVEAVLPTQPRTSHPESERP